MEAGYGMTEIFKGEIWDENTLAGAEFTHFDTNVGGM